jgi:hypothetical protein
VDSPLQIPHTLRIIFETCDLSYASPATVSRCHIVRVTDDVVPLESLNQSWLKRAKLNDEYQELSETYLRRVIKPAISFVMEQPEDCAFIFAASYLFQVHGTDSLKCSLNCNSFLLEFYPIGQFPFDQSRHDQF